MKGRNSESARGHILPRLSLVFVALAALTLGSSLWSGPDNTYAQNLPVHLEALRGSVWNGQECCNWKFTWTHKSGPFFSAKWWNPNGERLSDDNIVINILDDRVEIVRAGGSSAGGCTYTGRIYVGHAGGEYSCAGRNAGKWGATILP
jgi:hypothetical protein